MTLQEIETRKTEIETREAEIKAELEKEPEAKTDEEISKEEEKTAELEKEVTDLTEERKGLIEKENTIKADAEERKKLLEEIATSDKGKEVEKMDEEKRYDLKSPEYRTAWAKTLMQLPLNKEEQRALGVALTTTSETYVAPTSGVNGVNNGGLFIPESVSMAILKEIELQSPFLADVAKTAIAGTVKFPYKVSTSDVEKNVEGTANTDASYRWAELSLTVAEISKTIRVTWKLEAMAVEDFISYIQSEMAIEMAEALADAVIYGTGTNDVTGATIGAIDGSYSGDVLDGIQAGLDLLPKRKRRGAKIYIADDIANDVTFLKDDEGRYQFSPINNTGLNAIAKYTVEVDPFLNDGDFIIGNASRNYRMNTSEPMSIVKDIQAKSRINDYVAYTVVAGAPVPSSFVYGQLSDESV